MQPSSKSLGYQDDDEPEMVFEFTPEQVDALEQLRAEFTPDDIAEIKRRQRESDKLIAKLAATPTLEQQQQLAVELCPEFDDWIRGRNRVRFAARRLRTVAAIVPRVARTQRGPRERRDASSSRTSGQDPGGGDPDGFKLVLTDEQTSATQSRPRYCRCEADRPFTAPNWDIGPDGGDCRSCTLELRPRDVRYWHAVARSERSRLLAKGWDR